MKIAIIGAGFTGLSAAYTLLKKGVSEVSIFEGESKPGGLALGFKEKTWEWSFEAHYHHWFTNDKAILHFAKELDQQVEIIRPKTSTLIGSTINQLDSPISLLKFRQIPLADRLRTGALLAYLKVTPFWKNLEKLTAKDFLVKYGGNTAWKILWQPLFIKKFGKYYNTIPAAWFWARIKKRTPSLAYPQGGFQEFADAAARMIENLGGHIYYKTPVKKIEQKNNKIYLTIFTKVEEYDAVICTLPGSLFVAITPGLNEDYKQNLTSLKGIGAINLVLSLNKPFLTDGTYWLNVNNLDYPFLAIVEHTNFINKTHYNNEHLVYIGNYFENSHPYFRMAAPQLLKEFMPYLIKINPKFDRSRINRADVFKAPFAQPIIPLNYSEIIPPLITPLKRVYLANMQQVYPWDRGTNYAVELGKKVAEQVLKNS